MEFDIKKKGGDCKLVGLCDANYEGDHDFLRSATSYVSLWYDTKQSLDAANDKKLYLYQHYNKIFNY